MNIIYDNLLPFSFNLSVKYICLCSTHLSYANFIYSKLSPYANKFLKIVVVFSYKFGEFICEQMLYFLNEVIEILIDFYNLQYFLFIVVTKTYKQSFMRKPINMEL